MRISTQQAYTKIHDGVSTAQERLDVTTTKATTFKNINKPSDDPKGWVRSTAMRDKVRADDTIAKNAQLARHFLTATEDILTNLQDYVGAAHKTALQTSDSMGEDARQAAIHEVKGLFNNALKALNSRFSNRTLLAGHKSLGPAFNDQGQFLGDEGKIMIESERGSYVQMNLSAKQAIMGEGLKDGTNIPELFTTLIEGLETNNVQLIRQPLDNFIKAIDQLSTGRAQVGAWIRQIDRGINAHELERIATLDSASQIDEADPGKAFVEMTRDRVALNAALQVGSKIMSELPKELALAA